MRLPCLPAFAARATSAFAFRSPCSHWATVASSPGAGDRVVSWLRMFASTVAKRPMTLPSLLATSAGYRSFAFRTLLS